jgi:hypothetical protein
MQAATKAGLTTDTERAQTRTDSTQMRPKGILRHSKTDHERTISPDMHGNDDSPHSRRVTEHDKRVRFAEAPEYIARTHSRLLDASPADANDPIAAIHSGQNDHITPIHARQSDRHGFDFKETDQFSPFAAQSVRDEETAATTTTTATTDGDFFSRFGTPSERSDAARHTNNVRANSGSNVGATPATERPVYSLGHPHYREEYPSELIAHVTGTHGYPLTPDFGSPQNDHIRATALMAARRMGLDL